MKKGTDPNAKRDRPQRKKGLTPTNQQGVIMEFFKDIIKNRKLIWQLGKNDFKNRFASTSLGTIWGFLQPFIFMITYAIVFQFILKTGSSGEYPYAVWFFPGMTMCNNINCSIKFCRIIFSSNCYWDLCSIWIYTKYFNINICNICILLFCDSIY